jgi:hypothetical protein
MALQSRYWRQGPPNAPVYGESQSWRPRDETRPTRVKPRTPPVAYACFRQLRIETLARTPKQHRGATAIATTRAAIPITITPRMSRQ